MSLKNSIIFNTDLEIISSTNEKILKNKDNCKIVKTDLNPISLPILDDTSAILVFDDEYIKLVIVPEYNDNIVVGYVGICLSQATVVSLSAFKENIADSNEDMDTFRDNLTESISTIEMFKYLAGDENKSIIEQYIENLKQIALRLLYDKTRQVFAENVFLCQMDMNKQDIEGILKSITQKINPYIKKVNVFVDLEETNSCFIYETKDFLKAACMNMIINAISVAKQCGKNKITINQQFEDNICTICVCADVGTTDYKLLYDSESKLFIDQFAQKNGGSFVQICENEYVQTLSLNSFICMNEFHQPEPNFEDSDFDIVYQYLTQVIDDFFPQPEHNDYF